MKFYFLVKKVSMFLLLCWFQITGICSLRNVYISMPDAVEKGHKVRMVCKYNLEGETLYTLKWYKQELEFFRYTPKETPKSKFFRMKPYPELEIIKEESYGDQVTIRNATLSIAGHFACEVTTELPSFHAVSGHGELKVVVLPPENQELPLIKGYKPKVKEGEWANVTCISAKTIPAANLTWTINNRPISGKHKVELMKRVIGKDDLEESKSNLSFEVTERHFKENNSVKVRCTASIYSIYQKMNEINILPYRPVKTVYRPEEDSNPLVISAAPNIRLSAPNVDTTYSENNNNVNEPGNLENKNRSKMITSASVYVLLVAIMTRLLC